MVEATKSTQTIFDFVFASPRSQFITKVNLALLSLAAVNFASLPLDSSIGLNLSLFALDHLVKAVIHISEELSSDLINHVGFRIQKTTNNPGRFTFSHVQI